MLYIRVVQSNLRRNFMNYNVTGVAIAGAGWGAVAGGILALPVAVPAALTAGTFFLFTAPSLRGGKHPDDVKMTGRAVYYTFLGTVATGAIAGSLLGAGSASAATLAYRYFKKPK